MTRWLDIECEHCGGKKEMYYRPWCSNCNTPTIKIIKSLNLLKCFRHLERRYYGMDEEYPRLPAREEIWGALSEWGLSNDVRVSLPIVEAANGDGSLGDLSDDAIELLQLMVKTFQLEDHPDLVWEISW